MGTKDPLVHIEAATLAGGDNNQDRYAFGDGWAFVLDGATSFAEAPPIHDGGWYAERLKCALAEGFESYHEACTNDVIARAIFEASAGHDPRVQGPCPTSTISLARWNPEELELYVLGDSYAAIRRGADRRFNVLFDGRLDRIGNGHRSAYRRRLANGGGFDEDHRAILVKLQKEQLRARNRNGGYWIAADNPDAAAEGLRTVVPLAGSAARIVLATDGVATMQTPDWGTFSTMTASEISKSLRSLYIMESSDFQGRGAPRSKLHDDKTVVSIELISAEFEQQAKESCESN